MFAPRGAVGRADAVERRRVFDASGALVLEAGGEQPLPWPVLSQQAPIFDGERLLGHTEAARSLHEAVVLTAFIGLGAGLFGALVMLVLRVLPLRLLRQALDQAAYFAAHDPLTGLANRLSFADQLGLSLARSKRDGSAVAVLCLDLDRFKEVNDSLGHAAGDQLLQQVASRLSSCLRAGDTLARLGGDEFAVVQVDSSTMAAESLARRLLGALHGPVDLGGQLADVGVTIGIAITAAGNLLQATPAQILVDADLALYRAKEEGRGTWRFFEAGMHQRARARRELEHDLRHALEEGALRLHYQPQVDLATGQVKGAEALLRWTCARRGQVPPSEFIPVAEETGLILSIGAWALREACREARHWPAPMAVAVNVSPVQFRQPGLLETVQAALQESGLPPSRLELEITEGVLINNTEETLTTLRQLASLGVRIAMDDFGTGYSSLSYLQRFPFHKIKVDRSFIANLGSDARSDAIVRAIVGIARALQVRVNAEGVETSMQANQLREEGCDEAQGYLFARAVPATVLRSVILPQALVGRHQ